MRNDLTRQLTLARAFALVVIATLVCSGAAPAHAQGAALAATAEPPPTPWDRGRVSLVLAVGSASSFNENYFLVSAGIGYFVYPGLEVGVEGEKWFAGDPSITVLSPQVRYVAVPLRFPLKPYIGGFYNHYFVSGPFEDLDTVGGRLGAVISRGRGVVFGAGAVAEWTVSDCAGDCTSIYPEVSIGFTF